MDASEIGVFPHHFSLTFRGPFSWEGGRGNRFSGKTCCGYLGYSDCRRVLYLRRSMACARYNKRRRETCKQKQRHSCATMGRLQSANPKFARARGPQNQNPAVFDQTRCARTFECIEFALNDTENWSRRTCSRKECSSKRSRSQMNKMKGALESVNVLLVGTVRPPEMRIRF